MSLTIRTLFIGAQVAVRDVVCDGTEADERDEASADDVLVLPRTGSYTVTSRHAGPTVADANQGWFLARETGYRVTHSGEAGDRSTVIAVHPSLLEEVRRIRGGTTSAGQRAVLRTLVDARSDFVHRSMVRRLQGDLRWAALEIEDATLDLVDSCVQQAFGVDGPTSVPAVSPRHGLVVARVQEVLNDRLDSGVSLGELARDVGWSPYHLSRVFNRVTGSSLRTYVMRLRVRVGVDRLMAGDDSITTIAHDLGFADHSHFTHSVRREVGMTPREVRRRTELAGGRSRQ